MTHSYRQTDTKTEDNQQNGRKIWLVWDTFFTTLI